MGLNNGTGPSAHLTGMHRTGTAGWSLPIKPSKPGSHLYHYSRTLGCVEINSSFYRPHRASTWARWASETPPDFRFSIKAPRTITHEAKLRKAEVLLKAFLEQIEPLQEKAGPILFQLPPSFEFEAALAGEFLALLRTLYKGDAALEPRHATWFTEDVEDLLKKYMIPRVAADPPKGSPDAGRPGGAMHFAYYRFHGSPRTYYSNYDDPFLSGLAARVKTLKDAWIIFDNTALSHAYPNALSFQKLLQGEMRELGNSQNRRGKG
jgi:uncharacterized protein YecE (DUF72 family)